MSFGHIVGKSLPKLPKTSPYLQTTTWAWLKSKGWTNEVRFHPTRKWRWDFGDLKNKIAIEVQGGVWIGGRHTSGSGFVKDMEKYNAGVLCGWKLLAYTPQQFKNGAPLIDLEALYNQPIQTAVFAKQSPKAKRT